jgi:hypothetical protein
MYQGMRWAGAGFRKGQFHPLTILFRKENMAEA